MKINLPLPEPFYVISAKDEHGNLVFLQDVHTVYASSWTKEINEFTKRYDEKSDANEILEIQQSHFPEQNRNLSAFKIKKIKVVYTIV